MRHMGVVFTQCFRATQLILNESYDINTFEKTYNLSKRVLRDFKYSIFADHQKKISIRIDEIITDTHVHIGTKYLEYF